MTVAVEVLSSIEAIDGAAYDALHRDCGGPAYYDRRFLRAAERAPLLPYEECRYLVVRDGADLLAFMPAYLQSARVVDPFGLLARGGTAGLRPEDRGFFSHVMHCGDTRILAREPAWLLCDTLIERLASLTTEAGLPHFALMNISDPTLLAAAKGRGLEVRHMVDRYWLDLTGVRDFEDLIARRLPRGGRNEMRRQLRRFEADGARVVIEAPPFSDLEEVGGLCHETTARNGTPDYLPAAVLARFIALCGDLVRLVSIYAGSRRLGVGVLLLEKEVLHFWLCGTTYAPGMFSPYTVAFAEVYRYALANGYRRVEGGRLNVRIKERLGLVPLALHAAISPRTPSRIAAHGTGEAATPSSTLSLQ